MTELQLYNVTDQMIIIYKSAIHFVVKVMLCRDYSL